MLKTFKGFQLYLEKTNPESLTQPEVSLSPSYATPSHSSLYSSHTNLLSVSRRCQVLSHPKTFLNADLFTFPSHPSSLCLNITSSEKPPQSSNLIQVPLQSLFYFSIVGLNTLCNYTFIGVFFVLSLSLSSLDL